MVDVFILRKKLEEEKAAREYRRQHVKELISKAKIEEVKEAELKKCRAILQASALKIHTEVKNYLDNVVSLALRTVFDDPYKFETIFETKRNETECRLVFTRGDLELDPLDECGHGAADVAAFALRAAILKLIGNRPVIFSDEPFRNVSPDRMPYVVDMIETVNKKLGLQIIMITNRSELIKHGKWDKVISVYKGRIVAE